MKTLPANMRRAADRQAFGFLLVLGGRLLGCWYFFHGGRFLSIGFLGARFKEVLPHFGVLFGLLDGGGKGRAVAC